MMTLIVLILIGGLVYYIHTRPDQFAVSRSATMAAPPQKIFDQVNNLRNWEAWSPWARLDPNAKTTFAGPDAGAGAVMSWEGNMKVGTGSMTITESRPAELVKFRLDFLKPMKGTSSADFSFRPEGNQTNVTWTMQGTNDFKGKAMSLIFNCEKMVGGNFEQGLANLKGVMEK